MSKMVLGNLLKKTMAPIAMRRLLNSDAAHNIEKSINRVTLLGRVGQDPQAKGSEEHPVVTFNMATNTTLKSQGELRQRTEWHKISVFKPFLRDTTLNYLRKGSRVFVEGRIMNGVATDAKGIEHTTVTIVADEVIFVNHSSSESEDAIARGAQRTQ